AQLPSMTAGQLSSLTAAHAHALEQEARQEPGLAPLIAAALRDLCTPLSVLLPVPDIGEPGSGHQVPLLWGLRHTVGLLTDGAAGMPEGTRGWSFSTFEPPFDATTTDRLPGI